MKSCSSVMRKIYDNLAMRIGCLPESYKKWMSKSDCMRKIRKSKSYSFMKVALKRGRNKFST